MCYELLSAAAVVLALGMTAANAHAPKPNLVLNGDFSLDADGDGLADSWEVEGGKGVAVTCARERGAHERWAQGTTYPAGSPAGGHAMLLQQDTIRLQKGHWYVLTFNAKGDVIGKAASVAINQTEPWDSCGLQATFRVRQEWRPQHFLFRANRDISTNVRLQIWITEPGSLWVEDVRLAEAEGDLPGSLARHYTEAVPPVAATNLVPNGSFEAGTSGWGSVSYPGVGWGHSSLSSLFGQLESGGWDGESCFRIDLDQATAPILAFDYFDVEAVKALTPMVSNRGWISVEPGEEYTLSAYVKADPAGTPCVLGHRDAFRRMACKEFAATEEWRRYTFTFRPETDQLYVGVGPDLRNSQLPKATVWVDAVHLEKGAQATPYEARAEVEVGLEWPRPGHLFSSASEARATITASNAGSRPEKVRASITVTDFFDRVVATPQVDLGVPARGNLRREVHLGVSDKGFYRLRLESDRGMVLPVNAERFGVIDVCRDTDGIFGMNHAYATDELQQVSRDIGLTWFRDWSLKWHQVEPTKGRFCFAELDYQIDRVLRQGLNVLGLLPFPSNDWSTSAPPNAEASHDMGEHARYAYKPRDLGEYADYVRATVRHYQDRIHTWEVLNEPLYTGYALPRRSGFTAEDYVDVLRTAYRAIKEADPSAFVIGGIAGPPQTLTSEFIAAGGLDWVDALNLHMYPVLRAPEKYLSELEALAAEMRNAGRPKPICFTEGSYYGDDDLPVEPYHPGDDLMRPLDSELECASYQARFNLILLAHGTTKIVYHAGTAGSLNDPSVGGIFFEWDAAPRKMAIAQAVMTSLFAADTRPVGRVWERGRSFVFHSRGRSIVAVWDEKEQGLHLVPKPGARVLDLAGATVEDGSIPLGESPYYIVFEGTRSLAEVKETLREWLR